MKKLLAMVLALVMTLSLAVSANAFKDDTKISDDYAEAVAVLNGMGVFKGYEDGSFKPEGNITRAEVATIIYRIYTADVAKNDKSGLYATYNKFSDMAGASWAAGYIGYCANAALVKGYPDGTFKPSGKVTGYEVLAMILRAVGYDKNNEFSGADWALHVAQTAQQLGVLDNVDKATDLNAPASRELVAELLFQGIQKDQVTYTPAFGYVTDKVTGKANSSLGTKNFNLKSAADNDEWGRPAKTWTYTTGDTSTTFVSKPDVTYTVATTECDIAHDISLKENKEFTLYTNGSVNGSKYVVQPLDTVQKLGAQGTLLEVYKDAKVIVAIDTFLAKVTDVKEATYDPQGHLKTPASITLGIYTIDTNNTATATTAIQTNGSTNYTYAKGDMVLVNAYTKNTPNADGSVTVNSIDVTSSVAKYMEILGTAKTLEGAQTFLWYNNLKHTVEGTNYDDAKWFKLDQAGTQTEKHVWYFDSYGNLIGATDIATQYTYGVIENIQWQNPALATGYAQATIRYMDGTTETKVVTSINGNPLTYATGAAVTGIAPRPVSLEHGYVSTTMQENAEQFFGTDLYRIETAVDGTVKLNHVAHTDTVATTNITYNSQLTSATIKGNSSLTALAAIIGTPAVTGKNAATGAVVNTNDTHNIIYTNSNTTFLIQSVSAAGVISYNVVKGYENVPNYSSAKVDYVNLDGDSYADYVYITGTPDNATYFGMFYLTNPVVKQYLKAAGGTDYYEIEGYVDGVKSTIKLDAAATIDTGSGDMPVAGMTKAVLESVLRQIENKMVTVSHVNDRVVAVWGPKADIQGTGAANDALFVETQSNVAYTNLALDFQAATNVANTVAKTGNVLKVGSVYYNILAENLASTTNGYAWGETEDLSNKEVYVIYDKVNTLNSVTYVAKAVYVADPASSGTGSGVPVVTPATMTLTKDPMGNEFTATLTPGSAGAASLTGVKVYMTITTSAGTGSPVEMATTTNPLQFKAVPSVATIGTSYTITATAYVGTNVVAQAAFFVA